MLDDRKKQILQAIIDDYINTAEPVGSRTIVKKYQLGLSSATIRNEMADLEDMGYLKQPHTSAGRVPSLSGYRLYVDQLMTQYSLTMEEINVLRSVMEDKLNYLDSIIAKASGIMSELTNYTSVVVGPKIKTGTIKHLRLIFFDKKMFLAIIVTNEGIVRDKKIRLDIEVNEEELISLEKAINNHIVGLDFSEITIEKIISLVNEAKVQNDLVLGVFEFIQECISYASDTEVYIDGTTNIFNFPEYSDVERVKKFLKFVGNRKDVLKLINDVNKKDEGITISIGDSLMEDCSIITSRYKIGNNMEGFIGLIGPVRMDYKKAVSVMKHVTGIINNKMLEISGQEDGRTNGERKDERDNE